MAVRNVEFINDENSVERVDETGNENDDVQEHNSEDDASTVGSRKVRPEKEVQKVQFTLKNVEDSLEKFTAEKNEKVE